jgi:3-mercaptopyruvate sulfurtransferase SseA
VAHTLREQGFNAFVIVGGLAAWRKAGEPTETVPQDDLVHLPTFSRPAVSSASRKQRLEKPIG